MKVTGFRKQKGHDEGPIESSMQDITPEHGGVWCFLVELEDQNMWSWKFTWSLFTGCKMNIEVCRVGGCGAFRTVYR